MSTSNLAQQALNNLVNQFARPMDFLRELVQNAIDAGSPRVEVSVKHIAGKAGESGVLEIHIADFGEGMDERIIDEQLTRMFSSTKEDDLTKIGKFGIGFTSIFAINPEAVILHTGRHGEFWELLFHPDRSFDKSRVDRAVDGTRITLFKGMPDSDVDRFVRECRWILRYWCEHSDTPVTFWDRTGLDETVTTDSADPFAAFSAPQVTPSGPETVTRPLDLNADLHVEERLDALDILVGYATQPRYGFYNGGLTLMNTRSTEPLGHFDARVGHLSFKVKSDALEHTLTRDNVIQDEHWQSVMTDLVGAARKLQEALLGKLKETAESSGDVRPWLRHLARDCRADPDIKDIEKLSERIWLLNHADSPVTLAQVDEQLSKVGTVLLDPGPGALQDALVAEDLILLPDEPEVRELLRAAPRGSVLYRTERPISTARSIFVLPQLIDIDTLPNQERRLLIRSRELLRQAVGKRVTIRAGDFGGVVRAAGESLVLEGPEEGGLFQRPQKTRFRLPLLLKRRSLLINRHHPFYRAQILASESNINLAAFGLVSAMLHVEDISSERTFRHLLNAAGEEVMA
ncbi:MAG: hypothetical protein ACI8RZ_002032 [Myxococcota bacterium]|jgi:hypothetical protein